TILTPGALVQSSDSSGIIIFYCKHESIFYICNINCSRKNNVILSDNELSSSYLCISDYKSFMESNGIQLVHINNISSDHTELTLPKNKLTTSTLNLSLKNNTKSQKEKRNYFEKLLHYFNDTFFYESFQEKIYFELKITPSSFRIINRAINIIADKDKMKDTSELFDKGFLALREISLFNYHNLSNNLIGMNVLAIISHLSKLIQYDINRQNQVLLYFLEVFSILKIHHNDNMAYHNLLRKMVSSLNNKENWSSNSTLYTYNYPDLSEIIKNTDIKTLENALEKNLDMLFSLCKLIEDHGLEYNKVNNNACKIEDFKLISEISEIINRMPNEISSNIILGWSGISTGELAYSHIFSETFSYLINSVEKNITNSIIFIDEVDLYLHPEWQRTFLHNFLSLIKYCHAAKGSNIPQIILTTHSPIIAGDFLPRDIISLYKEIDEYNDEKIIIKPSIGFGTSISDLYLDGMHLTAIFGEHSKKHIDHIMNHTKNGTLTEFDKKLISQISDKYIRDYLLSS
ncbi:AAA family ATPase, partial [Aeromonas veronii]|uniref:AAA family ATPase n=6 Tax=Aeromonas veronii TaxID=654 RepID=UPI0035B84411